MLAKSISSCNRKSAIAPTRSPLPRAWLPGPHAGTERCEATRASPSTSPAPRTLTDAVLAAIGAPPAPIRAPGRAPSTPIALGKASRTGRSRSYRSFTLSVCTRTPQTVPLVTNIPSRSGTWLCRHLPGRSPRYHHATDLQSKTLWTSLNRRSSSAHKRRNTCRTLFMPPIPS